jgi:hypothetical protein
MEIETNLEIPYSKFDCNLSASGTSGDITVLHAIGRFTARISLRLTLLWIEDVPIVATSLGSVGLKLGLAFREGGKVRGEWWGRVGRYQTVPTP